MAKFYKRGEPATDELKAQAAFIRDLSQRPENADALSGEFGDYKLHDLVNGEVELEAEDGYQYRMYFVYDAPGSTRLVVDDYHPEEDADKLVDAAGNLLEPYDDPEVP